MIMKVMASVSVALLAMASVVTVHEDMRQQPMLAVEHITHEAFNYSVVNPRQYDIEGEGLIVGGVVPHHVTAATLISGFFAAAAENADYYDLVIIIGPAHEAVPANIVISYRDWDVGGGVRGHSGFADDLMVAWGINAAISHEHMEADHTASILIPYVYHYLPDTKVAPILLARTLSFGDTLNLHRWLADWIADSGENVLLVASIDFSHFLTPTEAVQRDIVTARAIGDRDFGRLHSMNYHYLDSPAAMIIFLKHMDEMGASVNIVDHTDASEFLGPGLDETTSYMLIVGVAVPAPDRVRLTFTGDLMLHAPQMDVDFDRTFSQVRPHLQSADLAIGNLETVLAGHFSDFPLFSAPDEFGYALRDAGFDMLSTANNHSLDQGVDGLLRNLDFLHGIGIDTFGTYRSREERDDVAVREVGGINFAFLAYTFGTNVQAIPHGREYLVNLMNENLIRADIIRARELADIVIVMPHMGNEYEEFVRQEFKDWTMMMLSAGADVVVAGHPHVVQDMGFVQIVDSETGQVRRGFVAYCLGNFVSSQREIPRETGVMLDLYFEKNEDGQARLVAAYYVPIWVKFTDAAGRRDIMVLPIAETLRQVDDGVNMNLRQADINRMRNALREISEIISDEAVQEKFLLSK